MNKTFIRELDSFEEFFWQLEQVAPVGNVGGALVSGNADLPMWEDAWTKLHLAHPALSFSIRKQDGQRPYFVHTGTRSPLRHSNRPDQPLTTHMEQEVGRASGVVMVLSRGYMSCRWNKARPSFSFFIMP